MKKLSIVALLFLSFSHQSAFAFSFADKAEQTSGFWMRTFTISNDDCKTAWTGGVGGGNCTFSYDAFPANAVVLNPGEVVIGTHCDSNGQATDNPSDGDPSVNINPVMNGNSFNVWYQDISLTDHSQYATVEACVKNALDHLQASLFVEYRLR